MRGRGSIKLEAEQALPDAPTFNSIELAEHFASALTLEEMEAWRRTKPPQRRIASVERSGFAASVARADDGPRPYRSARTCRFSFLGSACLQDRADGAAAERLAGHEARHAGKAEPRLGHRDHRARSARFANMASLPAD